ncbi:MAG: PaaI family thioesterase [Bradyrhizobium sp.]|nr:PaaI family thioesterase [Bradyrhizobium sp.]
MATRTEVVEFLAREFPAGKCQVQDVGNASATVTYDIGPDELRPDQIVFGPVLMTVADVAIYVALLGEIGIVPLIVTTNLTVNFMRRPPPGRRIVGECKLLKVGKRQAVGEVLLSSEGAPEIVAHAVGTYSIPSTR